MKILLIQPPISDYYHTPIRIFPLGLLSIGSYLNFNKEKLPENFEIKILDCVKKGIRTTVIPKKLNYTKEFYHSGDNSPFSLFSNYKRYGFTEEEILSEIKEFSPDVIGISALFNTYRNSPESLIKIIKKELPDTVIVAGGGAATNDPLFFLNSGADYCITGEGEEAFFYLIKSLMEKNRYPVFDGIVFLVDIQLSSLKTAHIQDLSLLSPLDYTLIEEYYYGKDRISMIETSRSCPFRCSYCCVHQVFGKKFRQKPVDSVLNQIEAGIKAGITHFDFEDDNLLFYYDYAKELFLKIIEKFSKYQITFSAMNGVSFDSLDKELLDIMKRVNFKTLNLALVTSSKTKQKEWKRHFNYDLFSEIAFYSAELNLSTVVYQIIGAPNQTLKEMIETTRFIAEHPVLVGSSIFYAIEGTEIFKEIDQKDFDPLFARSTAVFYQCSEFTRIDIITLLYITRVINFLKSSISSCYKFAEINCSKTELYLKELFEKLSKDEKEQFYISLKCKSTSNKNPLFLGLLLLTLLKEDKVIYGVFKLNKNKFILKPLNYNDSLAYKFFFSEL